MKLLRNLLAILAVFQIAIPAGAQIGTGLGIPQVAARFIFASGGGDIINPPLTTLPQTGLIGMDIDPDSLGLSDGTEVTTVTDTTAAANVCTAPTGNGFTLKTNVAAANGHNVFRSAAAYGVPGKFLDCVRPSNLLTAMGSNRTWSVMVVYQNAGGTDSQYNTLVGDIGNTFGGSGFQFEASATSVQSNTKCCQISAPFAGNMITGKQYSSGDPASNVHTFIYSGDASFDTGTTGRLYLDGTMWWAPAGVRISSDATDHILIGSSVANHGTFSTANAIYNFKGDILRVIFWTTPLSAAEAWQADAYARNRFGKALATTGLTYFVVFDGDSQTQGTGAGNGGTSAVLDRAFSDYSMPWKVAVAKGLKLGQYANVGKPSARVSTGNANNLIQSAARDVDQFHAVTGLPIVLVWSEFYNEPTSGAAQATLNRSYCTARLAADPTIKIVTWTSLSSYTRDGANRDAFNASMVATPGDCGTIVPVHTNANIGVTGAAGGTNTYNTYFADGIHENGAGGTDTFRDVLLPYIHR